MMESTPPIAQVSTRPGHTIRTSYLVKQLELAIRARLDRITREHGLTTPQYTALSVLRLHRRLSSAQLARRSFVSAQSMNEMVAALERKGLVEREPDPANRRILRMSLTSDGERLLDACDASVDELETTVATCLGEAKLDEFRSLLRSCVHALTA